MTMKTDNAEHVGKHAFELAGLGLAPFRFVGMRENAMALPDGSTKAAGSCDYCGTGIRYEFSILSADGKRSVVGCDCINKVGDAGLMRAYKSSPEFRKLQREKRQAKALSDLEECKALLAQHEKALRAVLFPVQRVYWLQQGRETFWQRAQWLLNNSGAAGRGNLLHGLRRGLLVGVSWTDASLEKATPEQAAARSPWCPKPVEVAPPVFPEVPAISPEVRELAIRLIDGKGGFRDSIQRDLFAGRKLSGKALDITCDILAKQHGRAGSQAYDAQWQYCFRTLAPDQCKD